MLCPIHKTKCFEECCSFYTLVEDTKADRYVQTGCGLAMLLQKMLVRFCTVDSYRFEVCGNADWQPQDKMAEV